MTPARLAPRSAAPVAAVALALAPVLILGLALTSAGCGGSGTASPADGGPPLALDVWPPSPQASQLGLAYGASTPLQVRYHTADDASRPVANAVVHFSIFMDPAGSTLASDRGVTDANGVATVTVTAGQAEAQFIVAATATNAPEVDVGVNVSQLSFVELDVHLSWSGNAADTTLRAALFNTASCATLLPTLPTLPMSLRTLTQVGSNATTFPFVHLFSERYAVVGRAEDKLTGQLEGYACVDIGAGLVPSGSTSTLPLQLIPVVAAPGGTYTLTSQLTPAAARVAAVLAPWKVFGCSTGAAQSLLDAMGATSTTLAAALEAHRSSAGADGCRPATSALDASLQTLLTTPSAPVAAPPALQLANIYADLQSLVGAATLTSSLTVSATGASSFAAEHRLASLALTLNQATQLYDLVHLGEPIIDATNITVGYDGKTLSLGAHGFTLGWATLWLRGLDDLSLPTRVPALATPSVPALIAATVAAAARNGKSDCAAVSDLVCGIVGGSCDVTAACTSAKSSLPTALTAPFLPAPGIDLTLTGSASAVGGSDLTVSTLGGGVWQSPALASGTFTAKRP